MAGREIAFDADGHRLGVATTNQSGVAKLAVPAGHRGGRYVFTANFAGDAFYLASSAARSS